MQQPGRRKTGKGANRQPGHQLTQAQQHTHMHTLAVAGAVKRTLPAGGGAGCAAGAAGWPRFVGAQRGVAPSSRSCAAAMPRSWDPAPRSGHQCRRQCTAVHCRAPHPLTRSRQCRARPSRRRARAGLRTKPALPALPGLVPPPLHGGSAAHAQGPRSASPAHQGKMSRCRRGDPAGPARLAPSAPEQRHAAACFRLHCRAGAPARWQGACGREQRSRSWMGWRNGRRRWRLCAEIEHVPTNARFARWPLPLTSCSADDRDDFDQGRKRPVPCVMKPWQRWRLPAVARVAMYWRAGLAG